MPTARSEPSPDYADTIAFRCPSQLAAVTRKAAANELTTPSAYVRSALLAKLRADGFDLAGREVAA